MVHFMIQVEDIKGIHREIFSKGVKNEYTWLWIAFYWAHIWDLDSSIWEFLKLYKVSAELFYSQKILLQRILIDLQQGFGKVPPDSGIRNGSVAPLSRFLWFWRFPWIPMIPIVSLSQLKCSSILELFVVLSRFLWFI